MQVHYIFTICTCIIEICTNLIRARPVGSFMHRGDLKEYAKNLMNLAKKDLEKQNRRHFAFNVYKTSCKSV